MDCLDRPGVDPGTSCNFATQGEIVQYVNATDFGVPIVEIRYHRNGLRQLAYRVEGRINFQRVRAEFLGTHNEQFT